MKPEKFWIECKKCGGPAYVDITYGTGSQTAGETYVILRCEDCDLEEEIQN